MAFDVADPAVLRVRAVHRAAAELRRGTPVLIAEHRLVVLAAETAGAGGLAEMGALAAVPPVLLVSPVRAAAILRRAVAGEGPVALRTAGLMEPAMLRGMADPTAEQMLPEPPLLATRPAGAEAGLMLAKLGRLLPAVLAAPVRADAEGRVGEMGLLSVAAADVLGHPGAEAAGLRRVAEARVPLAAAEDARIVLFRAPDSGIEHLAIVVGQPERVAVPLVRVHSECFTGDLLGSLRCDCGAQLHAALARMGEAGAGVLVYLAQEGRGIGLANKLRAYALQDRGLDTLDANRALGWGADERSFLAAATMLEGLGVRRVRLLTNNPEKVVALEACGIEVVGREGLVVAANGVNDHYLATKARRMGHLF